MYSQKNLVFILTILESIEKILIYSAGYEKASDLFIANEQMNFNACQILLMVIGEESKKISEELKDEHSSIEWNLIAGFRNKVAHDYRGIDPNITFDIIENYLLPLKSELILMIDKVDYDNSLLEKAVMSHHYSHLKYLLKID